MSVHNHFLQYCKADHESVCLFVLQSKVFSRTMSTQYTYSLQPIYVASLRKGLLATGKGCNTHGRSHREGLEQASRRIRDDSVSGVKKSRFTEVRINVRTYKCCAGLDQKPELSNILSPAVVSTRCLGERKRDSKHMVQIFK